MKIDLTFSADDMTSAFGAGLWIGRNKQRLLPYFQWRIEVKQKPQQKPHMLQLSITNEQQVTVHLAPKTPHGKPATLDGKPEWTVVSGSCTVTPSDDGLSATIVSGDTPGTSEISVSADADLGAGVETISDIVEVAVGGAKAANLGLNADAPEDKP